MGDYTKEELEAKKQALRNRSVLSYANTINGANLLIQAYNRTKQKINSAKYDLEHNTTGFYRDPNNSTRKIYRKQLESITQSLEQELKILEKNLDDLAESL